MGHGKARVDFLARLEAGDHEIQLLGFQQVAQLIPVPDLDIEHQPGDLFAQPDENIDGVERGRHRVDAQAQFPTFGAGNIDGLRHQLPGATEQLMSTPDQLLPGSGEHHRARITIEEPNAQVRFQRLDTAAERRLRQVGPSRSAGKMQFLAQIDQMAHTFQID